MKSGIGPRSWLFQLLLGALLCPAGMAWSQQYVGEDGLAYRNPPAMGYPGPYGPQGMAPQGFAPQGGFPVQQTAAMQPMAPAAMMNEEYVEDAVPGCPCDACMAACGCEPGLGIGAGALNVIRQCQPIYVLGEAVAFTRGNGYALPPNVGFTTSDYRYSTPVAPRLLVGYQLPNGAKVEGSYLGYWDNQAQSSSSNAGGINLPGNFGTLVPGLATFNNLDTTYNTRLQDAELNYFRNYLSSSLGTFDLLAGFRYINYGELHETVYSNTPRTSFLDYTVGTQNILLGGQVGGRLNLNFDLWGLEGYVKAGGYSNNATQHQNIQQSNLAAPSRNTTSNTSRGAFVGETGLVITYRLCGWLQIRGGYRIMYLDGIAAAPNQFDFTTGAGAGNGINLNGSSILFGPVLGVSGQF